MVTVSLRRRQILKPLSLLLEPFDLSLYATKDGGGLLALQNRFAYWLRGLDNPIRFITWQMPADLRPRIEDVSRKAARVQNEAHRTLLMEARRVLKHVNDASGTAAGYLPASVGSVPGSQELAVLQMMEPAYLLPVMTPTANSGQVSFWAGSVPELPGSILLNLLRRLPSGVYERAELMRSTPEEGWYLLKAADAFNAALEAYHMDVVFNAAKLWTSFHEGAVIMPFVAVAAEVIEAKQMGSPTIKILENDETIPTDEDEFRVVIKSFQSADDW